MKKRFRTSNITQSAGNASALVAKYYLEIKQSAQKELDALDGALFTRIDRKILALADNPRPTGCKN